MSTEQRPPAGDAESTVITTPVNTANPTGTANTSGVEWGAQQPKPKRSAKKIAIAAVVALGIAGAGAGVVYAASGSTDNTAQGPGGQGGMGGGPGGSQSGGPGGGAGLMDALHGEYVVSDGNGNYTTELLQNGDVTAISDSSVTVKSDDGYTHTYTIDSDTVVGNGSAELSSIATGDEVTVIATESGDTATVDTISEAGTTGQGGQMGQAPQGQSGTSQGSNNSSSSGN
jgi:hypothetical protein